MADEDLIERQRQLSDRDSAMINTELLGNKKNAVVAYLLWFFLGYLGCHKYYLNQNAWGSVYLICTGTGWIAVFMQLPIGAMCLFAVPVIGCLVDLFTIPAQIAVRTRIIRLKLIEQCEADSD